MKESKSERDQRIAAEDSTPDVELSPERLAAKKSRQKKREQRADIKKLENASRTKSEKEWWDGNRATLAPETLTAMSEQDAYIRDVLLSMETVIDVQQLDPELIQIVVELVKEHGVVHLGSIVKDADIPPDWSEMSYWRDATLLAKLEAENQQTAQYVRFGLLVALPDWRVMEFLQKAGWSWQNAADLVGYVTSHRDLVSYR
jgi:hypothetical protein